MTNSNSPLMDGASSEPSLDLVGGPFTVIESDPGVFTSLATGFGVKRVEVVELYDIEPWAVDHLDPYGLIFCFTWHKDTHRPTDFDDPAAERVWFANQLSDDACATHAILNVLFNCPELELGDELENFRRETRDFSPLMRGLAITNSPLLRRVHNSLARPTDIRASLNTIAIDTLNPKKKGPQSSGTKGQSGRQPKSRKSKSDKRRKQEEPDEDENPTYHFIGYVPAFGKVWELDGLKSGPLEVGELAMETSRDGWMDVVRPALRHKMAKYGGSGLEDSNIRFSLLAIVQDTQLKIFDELEFLRKDKDGLETQMTPGWIDKVDAVLYHQCQKVFECMTPDGYEHPPGFANRRMQRDVELMEMPKDVLIMAWQTVAQDAIQARAALDDEISKRAQADTEHLKRTFDYEPFCKAFVAELHNQGLLHPLLDLDENGCKMKQPYPKKKQKS